MKRVTSIISAVAVAVGVGGGVVAFHSVNSAAPAVTPVSDSAPSQTRTPVPTIVPGVTFAVAPCEPPAVLEDDECVTTVVQTVPAPAAPNADQSNSDDQSDQVDQTGNPGDVDHADGSDEAEPEETEDHGDEAEDEDHEDEDHESEDPSED